MKTLQNKNYIPIKLEIEHTNKVKTKKDIIGSSNKLNMKNNST